MKDLLKFLGISALLIGVFKAPELIKKVRGAVNVSKNLLIDVKNFTLSPLGFTLVLINQVREDLKITRPVIELYSDDTSFAYSLPDTQEHNLPSLGKLELKIKLKLRLENVFNLQKILNGKIKVKYTLYANDMFVQDTYSFKAKKV